MKYAPERFCDCCGDRVGSGYMANHKLCKDHKHDSEKFCHEFRCTYDDKGNNCNCKYGTA